MSRRDREKNGNCAVCGIYREVLQRDHIVPRHMARKLGWTKEQTDAPENIQRLCANCHQDKTLAEVAAVNKGRVASTDTRRKLAAVNVGRKHTEATRLAMHKRHRSYRRTPEHQAKLNAAKTGRVWTVASRAKASASKRGIPWSPIRRQRFEQSRTTPATARLFE
jgi:HNH endonuclease/NUMOD3 motif